MAPADPARRQRRSAVLRGIVLTTCAVLSAFVAPRWWCGREGPSLLSDSPEGHVALAAEVAGWAQTSGAGTEFHTGSDRFDGEWAYVACMMSVLGLGQLAESNPALRADYLPAIRACAARMTTAEARLFGTEAWGNDGLGTLGGRSGHAYLGYLNLALGMLRVHAPDDASAVLHDALTAALARRIEASPTGLIETYPSETYPPDVCAVVGSIGLHGRATGRDHGALVDSWAAKMRAGQIDPTSGLLIQSAHAGGAPADQARASGTAVCAYMVSFADLALSRDLYSAMRRQCGVTVLGFGAIREYPPGSPGGWGDVDSGPVVFGLGLSASGFAIASARMHGDEEMFTALWRSAYLFGAPVDRAGRRRFLTGGPLGNAILLAMTTARAEGQP